MELSATAADAPSIVSSLQGDEQERLRHSERRLRALVTATSDIVYRMSPDWTFMYQLDGRGFLADTDATKVAWQEEYLFEDDRAAIMAVVGEAIRTGTVFQHEHRVRQADGTAGWTFSRAIPITDDGGTIIEWFGAASDITERKRQEELNDLLTLEVQHRLKNTLGVVQAIARGTFKEASGSGELKAFEARLEALSSAHDVLTGSRWESADVRDVLSHALQSMPVSRLSLEGPLALLSAEGALSLALAAHELYTNASKYGALSTSSGQVSVTWLVAGSDLCLEWQEKGGPPVSKPLRRGFGTRVLDRIIGGVGKGDVGLRFEPEGLVCGITLPLATPEATALGQ